MTKRIVLPAVLAGFLAAALGCGGDDKGKSTLDPGAKKEIGKAAGAASTTDVKPKGKDSTPGQTAD